MTPDDLRIQRELINDGVVALWSWLHQLGTDHMTRADIELWYQLTKHPAIASKLGSTQEVRGR